MYIMADRIFSSKFSIFVFGLMIGVTCWSCGNKDCYQLQVAESKRSLLKGSPVIFGNGIVGYIEEAKLSNGMLMTKFCLPSSIRIPMGSKIYVGFIQAFSTYGIKIEPGTELDFISSKELLSGIPLDSIGVNFSESDTAITDSLIDIVKDINDKAKLDSLKK